MFAARTINFMYNVPFEDMSTSFSDSKRIRIPDAPIADGDYPETLPTWTTYKD